MDYMPAQIGAAAQNRSEQSAAQPLGRRNEPGRNSFESFLKAEPAKTNQQRQAGNTRQARRESHEAAGPEPALQTAKPVENVADAGEKANAAVEAKEKPFALPDEELLAELAALLGMPMQELAELLVELDIDLTEGLLPEQAVQLVQAAHNVSSPVELLWQSQAVQTLEQLSDLVNNHRHGGDAAETAEVDINSQYVTAQADVPDSPALSWAEMAQGAQMLDENASQLIVRGEGFVVEDETALTALEAKPEAIVENADAEGLNEETVTSVKTQAAAETTLSQASVTQSAASETDDSNPAPINSGMQGGELRDAQFAEIRETLTQNRTADTVEVVKQLVEQMKVEVKADTTELRLTLRPESLGEVTMRVITQNGIVTAQLYAESQRVKEAIEASLNDLKDTLTGKGLQIAEIAAYVAEDNDGRGSGWNGRSGRTLSGSRVSRIMKRNGLGEEGGEVPETEENNAPRNPLEVDYKA